MKLELNFNHHNIRQFVPDDHNIDEAEVWKICLFFSLQDKEDYELLKDDYKWPDNWSNKRRMLFLFTALSEYQMELHLKREKETDKKLVAIGGWLR